MRGGGLGLGWGGRGGERKQLFGSMVGDMATHVTNESAREEERERMGVNGYLTYVIFNAAVHQPASPPPSPH